MTNGNSAEREAQAVAFHEANSNCFTEFESFDSGWKAGVAYSLSVCADGGKGEAVACPLFQTCAAPFVCKRSGECQMNNMKAQDAAPQAECAPRADLMQVANRVAAEFRDLASKLPDDVLAKLFSRADTEKDAALTDAQIIAIATEHTEMVEDGEGSWPNVDWIGFARAILAANKEPQP